MKQTLSGSLGLLLLPLVFSTPSNAQSWGNPHADLMNRIVASENGGTSVPAEDWLQMTRFNLGADQLASFLDRLNQFHLGSSTLLSDLDLWQPQVLLGRSASRYLARTIRVNSSQEHIRLTLSVLNLIYARDMEKDNRAYPEIMFGLDALPLAARAHPELMTFVRELTENNRYRIRRAALKALDYLTPRAPVSNERVRTVVCELLKNAEKWVYFQENAFPILKGLERGASQFMAMEFYLKAISHCPGFDRLAKRIGVTLFPEQRWRGRDWVPELDESWIPSPARLQDSISDALTDTVANDMVYIHVYGRIYLARLLHELIQNHSEVLTPDAKRVAIQTLIEVRHLMSQTTEFYFHKNPWAGSYFYTLGFPNSLLTTYAVAELVQTLATTAPEKTLIPPAWRKKALETDARVSDIRSAILQRVTETQTVVTPKSVGQLAASYWGFYLDRASTMDPEDVETSSARTVALIHAVDAITAGYPTNAGMRSWNLFALTALRQYNRHKAALFDAMAVNFLPHSQETTTGSHYFFPTIGSAMREVGRLLGSHPTPAEQSELLQIRSDLLNATLSWYKDKSKIFNGSDTALRGYSDRFIFSALGGLALIESLKTDP